MEDIYNEFGEQISIDEFLRLKFESEQQFYDEIVKSTEENTINNKLENKKGV